METISDQKEVTAKKEHRCNFCCDKIIVGEKYITSTHKMDGTVYDWKTHTHCSKIANRLNMYEDCDEGLTEEGFQESIHGVYDDLLIDLLPKENISKYSDIIQAIRQVRFKDKLWYVIRHYNKIDKSTTTTPIK